MTLSNGRTSAYQWDYGLAVVTADADGTIARIANEHGSKAFVVEAENGLYRIPDILLTTGRAVVLYHVSGEEGTSLYTTSEDFLPVSEAPKPDDYIFTEEEIRTWKELDERLTDAEETIVQHTGEIADLTSAVSQNTADIAQHSSEIATNTGNIAQNTADINALESSVNALETDVNALETDVDALESGKISNPANKVTGGSLVWNGSAWVSDFPELGSLADVFVCEYGVTDYDVVDDAAASLLQVYVKTSDGCIPLTGNGSADHTFSYIAHNTATGEDTVVSLICKPTGWVTETTTIGSGGGTDDYTDLTNKPQINSVTLSGNKSSSDLGLADAVHTHSEYLTEETDPTVPSWAKASTKPSYTASEVGAIADPNSKSNGQVLTWNGSAWVAQTPSGGAEEIFTITLDSNWIPTNSYADIKAAKDAGKLLVVTKGINVFTVSDSDLDVSEGAISAFSSTGSQTTYVYLEYLDGDWTGNNSIVRFIRNPAQTSDGYVLTYDANTLQWVARAPSAGVTDYDDLTDKPSINNVTLSGNKTTSDLGISLTSLPDVFVATYNTTTIAELDAARTAGKKIFLGTSDGVLRPLTEYSWSPKNYSFISGEGDGETISIISCKETGNTTVWSNYRHSYLWVYTPYGPPSNGDVLTYDSTGDYWYADAISLSASDVGAIAEPSSASDGNVLFYDSQDGWVAGNLSASAVGAIPAPSSPTSGQFLSWNGSAWVATSLPVWNGGVT